MSTTEAARPLQGRRRSSTQPYTRAELGQLRAAVEGSWPAATDDLLTSLLARRQSRFAYAQLRRYAIRAQLDALIRLALVCGLRREEIYQLTIRDVHPDNAYVVVAHKHGPGPVRAAPYTDVARADIAAWLRIRAALDPEHESLWLNLHAATTARDPMTAPTFAKMMSTYVGRGWTLSRLRATAIVGWLRAGMTLEDARAAFGLGDIAELLPYARHVPGRGPREVERLASRFSKVVEVGRAQQPAYGATGPLDADLPDDRGPRAVAP